MTRCKEALALAKDPVGTLRCTWGDVGWRFVLILAALLFILETAAELAGVEQGSAWWAGELLSAVIVALWLSRHPLRGALTDTANMTVFLAIVLLLLAEAIITYTTVSDTFAAQPIFWPFSLMLMGTAIAARVVAPYVMNPLNLWADHLRLPELLAAHGDVGVGTRVRGAAVHLGARADRRRARRALCSSGVASPDRCGVR